MSVVPMTKIPTRERLANFLAITHSDCSLDCLPERVPAFIGQPTQSTYLKEADAILKLLFVDGPTGRD